MTTHSQPNGLPVHASCAALRSTDFPCNCQMNYGYIGDDVNKAIEVAERLEMRNAPILSDDEELGLTSTERGFWKNSEDLRCKAGLDFAKGEINFAELDKHQDKRCRS